MDNFVRNLFTKYSRILKKYSSESLLKLLSALEYSEAILEITASKVFGERFKWFIIFLTNLIKCVIRLQLLVIHKFGIQSLPSLFTLKNFLGTSQSDDEAKQLTTSQIINKSTFKLNHSGRIVRSIKNSPASLETRDWIVPNDEIKTDSNNNYIDEKNNVGEHLDPTRNKQVFLAEIMHVLRPICHLSSLAIFNANSWKQFMVPLLIDSFSLLLINGTSNLSDNQKSELTRRKLILLHYLIRTPFYEKYSSVIIKIVLGQIEQNISGSKYITGPILTYIPQWRSVYNYCWTS